MFLRLIYPEKREFPFDPETTSTEFIKEHLPVKHTESLYDVSVILPLYNVESYVAQCLDSIINQEGATIQLIVINDGSTDNSLQCVLSYLKSAPLLNAIVVEQPNRGLSAARNVATRFALGDYVAYLDTDDFMAPNAYVKALGMARQQSLDVVFFRSLVYDDQKLDFAKFYDSWVWDEILDSRSELVTNAQRHPRILCFEPNANTRIIRRALIDRLQLKYPEGLYFEDQPIHIQLLLSISRIGLLSETLYMYRVNRPGKITLTRSRRRFDILEVVDKTLGICKKHDPSARQGAHILYSILRITFWCGCEIRLDDRQEFFQRLCDIFDRIPASWQTSFKREYHQNLGLVAVLWALQKRDHRLLIDLSVGKRSVWTSLYFLLTEGRYLTVLARIKSAFHIYLRKMLFVGKKIVQR